MGGHRERWCGLRRAFSVVYVATTCLGGLVEGKPRLVVDDAVVNANRKMEMDAEDFLERQHRSGHMYARNTSSLLLFLCHLVMYFCLFLVIGTFVGYLWVSFSPFPFADHFLTHSRMHARTHALPALFGVHRFLSLWHYVQVFRAGHGGCEL